MTDKTARNEITGDKIQTKFPTKEYKEGFDKIKWNTRKEKADSEWKKGGEK